MSLGLPSTILKGVQRILLSRKMTELRTTFRTVKIGATYKFKQHPPGIEDFVAS